MTSTRVACNFGRAFGVFLGCIIGMCPLLFVDKTNKDNNVDGKNGTEHNGDKTRDKKEIEETNNAKHRVESDVCDKVSDSNNKIVNNATTYTR
ncbi:transmembrane protein 65-like [Tropilaelaps mercedesae]|uniref:Transmembrane protein 65-like n=1 Tax=Tropilaelaps mercedesae TaxID=418985 RepID=A0A1V9XSH6_9ACAR|nr:transmembrane protein 65-like [Tropilaelaps mercedesae]